MPDTPLPNRSSAGWWRGEELMPWSGKSFAAKHNHKLKPTAAKKAARMATGMVKAGVDEGLAIATANARAEGKKKRGKR